MKTKEKIKRILIATFFVIVAMFTNFSCEPTDAADDCDGMGTLKLTNKSLSTVQKVMIDGVNWGSIDPGESKEAKLAPGTHSFQLVGISGGTGCGVASVIIVACKTTGFSCSAK